MALQRSRPVSMDDETFTGSDGEVATLTIAVGDLAVGDKNVILRNIKLTETDISKSYTTDELVSTLTISSQESGDVNDIDNVIYLSPSAANPNSEATLSFKMKNTVGIRGFQFDLYLPNGYWKAEGISQQWPAARGRPAYINGE